jgi:putative acetyltransferase
MEPASSPSIELIAADGVGMLDEVRKIFLDYAGSLPIDLGFQGFEAELQRLPGDYAQPSGALMLALVDGEVAGCCAMRPITDVDYPIACEMKRLYVRPAFRRLGLGRLLAQAILDEGRRAGYSAMLLDTLDDMEAARELYAALGFIEVPPYYFNPVPGAHYLKADLI